MDSQNKIKNLVKLARTSKETPDTEDFPTQQITYFGKVGDATLWFPYGIHANIPVDYLLLLLNASGNLESRIGFPSSPQQRPRELGVGEIVIYHPITGAEVYFKNDGSIKVTSALKVDIDAPEVNLTGNLNVAGDAAIDGDTALGAIVTSDDINIGSDHVHSAGTPPGDTGVPK